MKNKLLSIITVALLLGIPKINFGQITLGSAASKFAIFSSLGAVKDVATTAPSHVTGDVGSANGAVTGFGNVNGVMHPISDASTFSCDTALTATIGKITTSTNNYFPSATMGGGVTLDSGVYSISGGATLGGTLTLDAQGDPSAQFIIKVVGTFGASANAKVLLVNGALACNVYWYITGAVNIGSPVTMRGNIISNAAITFTVGDSLEGRVLTTAGQIQIDGVTIFTPIGCSSPYLTGPSIPNLGSTACYTIFSSNGALNGNLASTSIGDVGNNGGGSVTGWTAGNVTGTLHLTGDPSTILCASDLLKLYDSLNAMPYDIELLYPAQFGHDLTLTPHVYIMKSAITFTDSLYLDAQGNSDGVFVIKTGPGFALLTSTYSRVKLINGAQAKNVFWLIQGAVNINNYSIFRGTIVSTGAINLINTGVVLDGRALTTNGLITTEGLAAVMPPGCSFSNITTQPANQTVCSGSSAKFFEAVTGTGLTYQWRKGTVNLVNGGHISGATSDTLIINPATLADTASNYNLISTGTTQHDTSNNVSLTVNTPPTIITAPTNQTVCAGSVARFSVVAKGTALTYQWRKGTVNLINGLKISGATSDTLRINPVNVSDTASNYNVVITGTCSPIDTSINVSLVVDSGLIITSQPINQTVCSGNAARFSIVIKGAVTSYQWKKGIVNLINGANISGATSDTLRINSATISDTSSYYHVVIVGMCSANDTTIYASLTINTAPAILSAPVNQTACLGSSAKFSVVAKGTGLIYQWRKGTTNLINGGNISGATSDTLRMNAVAISDTSSIYNVIITGTCLPKDSSLNVSLKINASPAIVSGPANQVACPNGLATFSIVANGVGITYQWRKGIVNLINGGNVSGATSASLTINPVTASDTASNYNVVITGTCSPVVTSANVSLRFNSAIVISTPPANQTVCAGNTATFFVTAIGGGLTYKWRKGTINLVNGGNISGATSDTLKINLITSSDTASNYNVIISGTCSPNDTSINVSLTIMPPPIAIASSNSPVCLGTSINLYAQTVVGATYQWTGPNTYSSTVQNSVILSSTLIEAGLYSLTVTNNGCTSIPSSVIVVVNKCDSSDLSVVKSVNNARPLVGTNVIFTIVATNNGPNTAVGITIDDTLQNGYTYVTSSTTKGTYNPSTGIWSIDTLYNGASATLTLTATVNVTGVYKNTATIKGNGVDKNPLDNISWVETFPSDFFIPQGFSPNGDGTNDLFVIRGIEVYPKNTFKVFNRWGDEVFGASPYQNTWDGTTSMGLRVGGNQLPVGTYFFILDLGDGSNIIKGTIYLNK